MSVAERLALIAVLATGKENPADVKKSVGAGGKPAAPVASAPSQPQAPASGSKSTPKPPAPADRPAPDRHHAPRLDNFVQPALAQLATRLRRAFKQT